MTDFITVSTVIIGLLLISFFLFLPFTFFVSRNRGSWWGKIMLFRWTIIDSNNKLIEESDSESEPPQEENKPDITYYVINKMLLNSKFRSKFLKSILNLFYRSTKLLKLRFNSLRCTVGWDDPAEVGVFFGFAQLIISQVRTLQKIECEIIPSFLEERFDFDVKGTVRLYPGRVFFVGVLFLFEFPMLSVIRLIRYVRSGYEKK